MYKIKVMLKCPECGREQPYISYKTVYISGKSKRCIFCEKNFVIKKERITKRF